MAKKIKGKSWYSLVAPSLFNNKIIGETLITNPDESTKRTVLKSLPEIGGHPSKYYIKIKFKGQEVDGDKIKMKYVGHECLRDFISQMVRKGAMRIDNRVEVETKDKKKLIIKTIGITLKKTKTTVKSELHKEIGKIIKDISRKKNFNDLVNSIMYDKFQKEVRKKSSVIYPLRRFEVRKVEVIG